MACEVCRGLQPKDCPGCAIPDAQCFTLPNGDCVSNRPCMHSPVTNVNSNVPAADVHDEMFRTEGEPRECQGHAFIGFSEMQGKVYPDKYGYYPGCYEG